MKPDSPPKGFTLLEVLVASAVSILVAAGAATVVVNALAWESGMEGRQRARFEAARVLDRLAADLAAFRPAAGPTVALALTMRDGSGNSGLWEPAANGAPPGALAVTGSGIGALRFGIGGVWLRFLAEVTDQAAGERALPRAVAYQIIRRQFSGRPGPAYVLHRATVRSGETDGRPGMWEAGNNLDPGAGGAFAVSTPGNDGSVAGDPFAVVRPQATQDVLTEDVVDFGVRLLEAAPDGSWRVIFPSGPEDREFLAPKVRRLPDAADLLVRVLTPAGAQRLSVLEAGGTGSAATAWWDLVAANSEVMTRRIYFMGGRP